MKNHTIPIIGNTYPVRQQLKAIGCVWNARRRMWLATPENADQAQDIVEHQSQETNVDVFEFSSGPVAYRNKRGLCEDAPCCGCCTF